MAFFITLGDGTVTLVVDSAEGMETELLKVFIAQTYGEHQPAAVLRLGNSRVQLIAKDRLP